MNSKVDKQELVDFVKNPSFEPDVLREQNKSLPKISIVIPSYNQGRFIERSILSALNQDYPNTELIIIDGGSTDETIDILKKYDEFITYWVSEPDRGQSEALNKGFDKATGDIYGWLNADDLYMPGVLEIAVRELKDSAYKVCMGDYYNIDTKDNILSYNYAFDFNVKHFIYEGFHCNAQAMLWKKELHAKFGAFDVELHRTMDYEMILAFGLIAGNDAFVRIEKPFSAFRRHENQKTQGSKGQDVVLKEHRRIAVKYSLNKFQFPNRLFYYLYRIRRTYWYYRRGGLKYLVQRIKKYQLNIIINFKIYEF